MQAGSPHRTSSSGGSKGDGNLGHTKARERGVPVGSTLGGLAAQRLDTPGRKASGGSNATAREMKLARHTGAGLLSRGPLSQQ